MEKRWIAKETLFLVRAGVAAFSRGGEKFPDAVAFPGDAILIPEGSNLLLVGQRARVEPITLLPGSAYLSALKTSAWYMSTLRLEAYARVDTWLSKLSEHQIGATAPGGFVVQITRSDLAILCRLSREQTGRVMQMNKRLKPERAIAYGVFVQHEEPPHGQSENSSGALARANPASLRVV